MSRAPGDPAVGGDMGGRVTLVLDDRSLVRARRSEREVGVAVEVQLEAVDGELGAALNAAGSERDLHAYHVTDVAHRRSPDIVDVDEAVTRVVRERGAGKRRQRECDQTSLHPLVHDRPPASHCTAQSCGAMIKHAVSFAFGVLFSHGPESAFPGLNGRFTLSPLLLNASASPSHVETSAADALGSPQIVLQAARSANCAPPAAPFSDAAMSWRQHWKRSTP